MGVNDLNGYLQLLPIALGIGQSLVDLITHHAQQTLSAADYAALEQRWNADVIRSAADAGIAPEPDK